MKDECVAGIQNTILGQSAHYPATYRASMFRRMRSILRDVILFLLAIFGRGHIDKHGTKGLWIFALVCMVAVIFLRINESSSRITLYDDRIEKKTWFSKKVWRRDEAVGLWFNLFSGFKLVRKYNKGDYFVVPAGIERDATWDDWLRDVPEADIKPSYPRFLQIWKQHRTG